MALRTLHVLLAVVAVSVSVEHVAGYMEPPEEDMSISTGSDGEVRMGHYGDYSDWVKKYHLGKHVPFRATKQEASKGTSVQYHHTNKVAKVASVPPSSQAKQVPKKAEKPVKKVKVKTVKKAAKQKAAKQTKTAHKAKKQSAKKVKEAAPSVVDELESELSGLEHKAAAPAHKAAPSAKVVHKKSAQRPKSELAESKDDTVSLDSLEASLDKLEAVPTEMLDETPVALVQVEAKTQAVAAAPDMMAMLAGRFKKKAKARSKRLVHDVFRHEEARANKEAAMAKKFQDQFMSSLNKKVDDAANKNAPKTIQEAIVQHTGVATHKMGKGSVSYEEEQAMKDAQAAKNMVRSELSYRKQLEEKQEVHKAPTKQSLNALFGKRDDKDVELGESNKVADISKADAGEINFAKQALRVSQNKINRLDKKQKNDDQSVSSLFGVKKSEVHTSSDVHQKLGEAQLNDSDKKAIEMQKQFLQRMLRGKQDKARPQEEEDRDISSLFNKKSHKTSKLMSASRQRVQQQFTQAKHMQEQMLKNTKTQHRSGHRTGRAESRGNYDFHVQNAKQQTHEAGLSEESKRAIAIQRKFVEQTQRVVLGDGCGDDDADCSDDEGDSVTVNRDKVSSLFSGQSHKEDMQRSNPEDMRQKKMQESMLHQMQARTQAAIQTSANNAKWDEYAYQNKLRALFGARPLVKPKKKKLHHKKGVAEFLADVKHEEKPSKKIKRSFTDLIQEETSEFNQLMAGKKNDKKANAFMKKMKTKFAALKDQVKNFQETSASSVANKEELVEVQTGSTKSPSKPAQAKEKVDEPTDNLGDESMLSRVEELFREAP